MDPENELYCQTMWIMLDPETDKAFISDPATFDFVMFSKADLNTPEIAEWN